MSAVAKRRLAAVQKIANDIAGGIARDAFRSACLPGEIRVDQLTVTKESLRALIAKGIRIALGAP